jgi:hypothetical protein
MFSYLNYEKCFFLKETEEENYLTLRDGKIDEEREIDR